MTEHRNSRALSSSLTRCRQWFLGPRQPDGRPRRLYRYRPSSQLPLPNGSNDRIRQGLTSSPSASGDITTTNNNNDNSSSSNPSSSLQSSRSSVNGNIQLLHLMNGCGATTSTSSNRSVSGHYRGVTSTELRPRPSIVRVQADSNPAGYYYHCRPSSASMSPDNTVCTDGERGGVHETIPVAPRAQMRTTAISGASNDGNNIPAALIASPVTIAEEYPTHDDIVEHSVSRSNDDERLAAETVSSSNSNGHYHSVANQVMPLSPVSMPASEPTQVASDVSVVAEWDEEEEGDGHLIQHPSPVISNVSVVDMGEDSNNNSSSLLGDSNRSAYMRHHAMRPLEQSTSENLRTSSSLPSVTSIARIFSIGQPDLHSSSGHSGRPNRNWQYNGSGSSSSSSRSSITRVRKRATRWIRKIVRPAFRSATRQRPSETFCICADSMWEAQSAESALAGAINTLAKTRSSRSSSFRLRADRTHIAQSKLLQCVYSLFMQLIPSEQQRSRHYRYYLPEDDQMELDRGFSESVLFAAQALARGFQIRGTESHTQALREPSWMLCSAWAAVRYVIFARGTALWDLWTSSRLQEEAMDNNEDMQALCRVLEDFDEAWVRFERDLCFAYFGLGSGQVPGTAAMDSMANSEDSGYNVAISDGGLAAHEEEFSLLVVLLSETLQRSLNQELLTQEQAETMDPQLILALPRLAILHAIAFGGGVDGLCFVESEGSPPVFWWFREFSEQCKRISNAVDSWTSPLLYGLLQTMLVAEEADVVLSGANSLLAKALLTPPVDIESIIDSPRTVRSMSIDCISSICATTSSTEDPLSMDMAGRTIRANSASCLEGEVPTPDCLNSRLFAAISKDNNNDGNGSYSPATIGSSGPALPTEMATTPVLRPKLLCLPHHQQQSLGYYHSCRTPSPSLMSRPMMMTAADFNYVSHQQRMECLKQQLKQAYVDICTVADSLHSGPFARPFRVALEMVFRMNNL